MRNAANCLDGQKLVRFTIMPRTMECVFKFDLGATLRTRPFDKDGEQWMLFDPSKQVLALRADARYDFTRSDVSPNQGKWKSIVVK